ncbi:MAG: 5-formyltetrahydrofolate cyclo-ligase [Wolbachia endosymbiont of Tyrophagus putrescentiae]|nr:5-formyltetrahydrofolate cyclo-ligase [Wolbachia endosymbiont of Tyrophagus putrescentiae]
MPSFLKQQKREIKKKYRAIRKSIDPNCAAESLVKTFHQHLNYIKGKTVAAYIPMDGEINVIPLMYNLANLGFKIAIPNKKKLLIFEKWEEEGESIVPDTIITPVVAFDDHFNRLGFGGGWYDRMIEQLRPLGKMFIGVAYEAQYCKDLPTETHDQKLDMIVTETRVRIRKS